LDALQIRMGEIPLALQTRLQQITDSKVLRQLHRAALRSGTVKEFEEAMPKT
jgi:hypothetical protein